LARLCTSLAHEGVRVETVGRRAAGALCPWLDVSRARLLVLLPDAGYIDGPRLAMAYAQAARARGARIWRGVTVEDILVDGTTVVGVRTQRGLVRTPNVVNAAGAWSPRLARSIGWYVAAAATRSHFWITAANDAGKSDQPNVTLPDYRAYTRREMGGLLIGLQEPVSRTFDPFELDPDLDRVPLFDETADLDLLARQVGPMREVVPGIDNWQFAHHIAGLSMYTPDGKFLIGSFPGLSGLFLAAGCCGSGVGASGGIGRLVADLVLDRNPSVDAELFRPDRFGAVDSANAEFRSRCVAARAAKSGAPYPG
jgi:sarcosine oxidase, subunit beta